MQAKSVNYYPEKSKQHSNRLKRNNLLYHPLRPLPIPPPSSAKLSIRDVYCQHPMISSEIAIELLDHSLPQSEKLLQTISLNLDSIKFGLPTQYIFTKSSQAGKTGSLRVDYF
ncbi:hypothetical protein BY996DRAFT_6411505 [Phakopsora pachyrhizi]|nr:hypothetical protein BY996DRAFT_6411505 [Phakopsora pachyrhizi]